MTTDTATPAAAPDGTLADAGVELQYTYSTAPFPLLASPASSAYHKANLTIVLTRRASTPIECSQITVSVPVGSDATTLAAETTGMTASTDPPGWTTPVAPSGQVTFTPPGGVATIDKTKGLALSMAAIPVNRTVGRALLTVTVRWRAPGEDSWNEETVELPIPKFPPTFSLGELHAVPTRIGHGGSVTLTWQAAGGDFRLEYDKANISVTGQSSHTVHNITRDTLFQLRGTSGELEAVRSVWMTLAVPDVIASSLTVTRSIVTDQLAAHTFAAPVFTATAFEHRPELSMRNFDPRQRRWNQPVRLPFGPASSPPALTAHSGKLHLLFRPYDSEQLRWAEYDGSSWRTLPSSPGKAASAPVALTSAGTSLVSAFQTPAGEQVTSTSSDGTSWGPPSPMPAPLGGAVSLCWDGTALYAAMRIEIAPVPGVGIYRRDAQQQWQEFHVNVLVPAVGSPELVLQGQNHLYYFRSVDSSVWSRWRHKNQTGQLWTTKMVGVKAAHDTHLAVAGPVLYALFPDSEGVLHLRSSSDDPARSSIVLVDEYRAPETPALAWYDNRLIAIGRGGACRP